MRHAALCLLVSFVALVACQPIQPPAEMHEPAPVATVAPLEEAPSAEESTQEAAEESRSENPLASLPDIVPVTGFVRLAHDPVIAEENGVYYIFYTAPRIAILSSRDLVNWEFAGRVFDPMPTWTREINPQITDLWAPDISYFNGKWHLYYAASNFGQQNSAIALATNVTLDPASPDYAWEDQGIVLRSNVGDLWNAIDANLVFDDEGNPWLAWGSFWNGLYIRRIDAATGFFDEANPDVVHIASRRTPPDDSTAVEAPFIVKRGDWYYLFVTFGQCCRGAESTYTVRVGRSAEVTGPYIDRDGVPMLESGGTRILEPYDRWAGPGHIGMLIDGETYWIVYHAYDIRGNGTPNLRIERVQWDEDDWPWLTSQVAEE